jgi:hypothetical protein
MKRHFRRWAALPLLVLLPLAACRRNWSSRPGYPRNLVVFCFDTVRADAFSRRDSPQWPDALSPWVRRAVVYENARSAAPWTVPSVASFMTGLYPPGHGAGRFAAEVAYLGPMVPSGVSAGVRTLGRAAREAGFDTQAFVSNPWMDVPSGIFSGFEHIDHLPTRALMPVARDWLEKRSRWGSRRPFFLYVHWMDAHGDVSRAEMAREASLLAPANRADLIAHAPLDTCRDPASYGCSRYLAYHRAVAEQRNDAAILLETMRRRGLLSDSVVVLFSDHGEEFNDHRPEEWRRAADPRGIYGSGHGHSLYDELLRVALVVWTPREAPHRDPGIVSLVDVTPTLVTRLGLPWSGRMDGRVLEIAGAALEERPIFASGISFGPEQAAVIDGDRKQILVRCPSQSLLFDERRDPSEKSPGSGAASDPQLAALLGRYLERESAMVTPMKLGSERMRKLRSVGYLAGAPGARGRKFRPASVGAFDPRTATFLLRFVDAAGSPDRQFRFGAPGDVPVAGDWDGSGATQVGVYNASARTFSLSMADGTVRSLVVPFGPSGVEQPLAGNWDGNGIDTVAIWRPGEQTLHWAVANRSGADWHARREENAGRMAVAGRWRCSGRSELAFYGGAAGFTLPGRDGSEPPVPFGTRGDVPLAGDWDGDGTVTFGVYRPADSLFQLRNAIAPGPPDVVFRFGPPGSLPVVGAW